MTPLFRAALDLQTFCVERKWRFCIIGGIALLRWGEPRYTRDVDMTLLSACGDENAFITPILAAGYTGRIPDAAGFALKNRVLLLHSPEGIPIDLALGALPFESRAVDRASLYEFEPQCELVTCSAEDLIVLKLFAFRTRDILDVEGIVIRQRELLDWNYIEEQLTPLAELKDEPEILRRFETFKRT